MANWVLLSQVQTNIINAKKFRVFCAVHIPDGKKVHQCRFAETFETLSKGRNVSDFPFLVTGKIFEQKDSVFGKMPY